jgi:hypothetical protein
MICPSLQATREKFAHFDWPPVFDAPTRLVNPMHQTMQEFGFGGTFCVADPCEIAADLMFADTVPPPGLGPA